MPRNHGSRAIVYSGFSACQLRGMGWSMLTRLPSANKSQLRYTHYNLLPESATFVAKIGEKVVGTLSAIVEMPPFGLPMETLYRNESAALRSRDGKLAEGSGLAVDPGYQPIGIYTVMTLVRHAITYARKLGATRATVACHPRHVRFYERMFLFERFGDLRTYHAVNDAPAVALHLDLENLEQTYRAASSPDGDGIYRFFFSDEILRRPDTPLRAGAFPREVNLRLCEKQPAVIEALEAGAPGLIRRITGEDPSSPRLCDWQLSDRGDWDTYPVFIAA